MGNLEVYLHLISLPGNPSHFWVFHPLLDFPDSSAVKNPPANAGDIGLIPGSGRFPGGGKGNPLQVSCLEKPMDRGAWQATVHGVIKSQT